MDWPHVVLNALWIVGCAVILAAFSHARWLAQLRQVRTRQLLGEPGYQLLLSAGLSLISLGLFFLSSGWLERIVWAAFSLLFVWQSLNLWRRTRRQSSQ